MQIKLWPMGVPGCTMPLTATGGPQDNRLSFETDSGHDISRARASWTPDVYQVEIVPMSRYQFSLFEAWFRDDLAFGANAFMLPHPITGIDKAWKVVPGQQPYTVTKGRLMPKGGSERGIKVSMRIREVYTTPVVPP